jgi:hypothetical protein
MGRQQGRTKIIIWLLGLRVTFEHDKTSDQKALEEVPDKKDDSRPKKRRKPPPK